MRDPYAHSLAELGITRPVCSRPTQIELSGGPDGGQQPDGCGAIVGLALTRLVVHVHRRQGQEEQAARSVNHDGRRGWSQ